MAKRILLIEDDIDNAEVLTLMLADYGEIIVQYKFISISDIIKIAPDIIILDHILNDVLLTGSRVCAMLKESIETRNIPVVLCSASTDLAGIAKQCDADGYVEKPFGIAELKLEVGRLL